MAKELRVPVREASHFCREKGKGLRAALEPAGPPQEGGRRVCGKPPLHSSHPCGVHGDEPRAKAGLDLGAAAWSFRLAVTTASLFGGFTPTLEEGQPGGVPSKSCSFLKNDPGRGAESTQTFGQTGHKVAWPSSASRPQRAVSSLGKTSR